MKHLQVLWLDDMRDPNKYFTKKSETGAFLRNKAFYDKLFSNYSINFIWVKNFEQFVKYILENGLPQFVSFDHDLGKGEKKGYDCAKWLMNYCQKTNQCLPKFFVHSANRNGIETINALLNSNLTESKVIRISEGRLSGIIVEAVKKILPLYTESVYVNNIDSKKKRAKLTYANGNTYQTGSKNYYDNIKTDKMDTLGSDTYEVPLKGGLTSYNITSIRGTEVMHYFKRYWDSKKTNMKIDGDDYELEMEKNEFMQFLDQFQRKVNYVVEYCYKNFKQQDPNVEFTGVSIYPVPSSSNFNIRMAEELKHMSLMGLPIQVINQSLLTKDLRTLKRDTNFIEKNKDYYSKNVNLAPHMNGSMEQYIDSEINKYNAKIQAYPLVEELNEIALQIFDEYYYINKKIKNGLSLNKRIPVLAGLYKQYSDKLDEIRKKIRYFNPMEQKEVYAHLSKTIAPIKYTKARQVDTRSDAIWHMVKSYFRGTGVKPVDIQRWDLKPFEIKQLPNGVRMGLRGIYNQNIDVNLVKNELNKIKGTIFVIFDDNISGGSTLSDICLTCKEMGIKNIVPITFGEMETKWGFSTLRDHKPINAKGEEGKFNY